MRASIHSSEELHAKHQAVVVETRAIEVLTLAEELFFELRKLLADSECVSIESVYGFGYRLRVEVPQHGSPRSAAARARRICDEAAHHIYDRRAAALQSALGLYQMAAAIDSDCIQAYFGYVETTFQLLATGQARTAACWPAARQALDDADQHQPGSAVGLALRGLGRCLFDWDYAAARAMLVALDQYAHRCTRGTARAVEDVRVLDEC